MDVNDSKYPSCFSDPLGLYEFDTNGILLHRRKPITNDILWKDIVLGGLPVFPDDHHEPDQTINAILSVLSDNNPNGNKEIDLITISSKDESEIICIIPTEKSKIKSQSLNRRRRMVSYKTNSNVDNIVLTHDQKRRLRLKKNK